MDAIQTAKTAINFDLIDYARRHRLRTRNLHDGGSVPPARRKTKPTKTGYVGAEERLDAIVGHRGYLTAENGGLGICLFSKSSRGVSRAASETMALGGRVRQDGDCELAGWLPVESIDAALKLIRVSKLRSPSAHLPPPRTRNGT